MLFEKKKIRLETLSEYLLQAREELELSLEQVSERTGIKVKFISCLEQGNFSGLPADVYVTGFLKQLAFVYGTDAEALIEQYKREQKIQEQLQHYTYTSNNRLRRYFSQLIITPKVISVALGGLFVVATLAYIVWQVFSINKTPPLEIFEPKDRQIIHGLTAMVSGHTDPGMSVTINGQSVFVDDAGNFKTQLGITSGPKDVKVVAQNRFGRNTSKTIGVVGEDEQNESASSSAVTLKLDFLNNTSVSFSIDGGSWQTGQFSSGATETLQANDKITLSTPDAGSVRANLNNQDLGVLGRPSEPLANVTFSQGFGSINTKN